MRLLLRVLIVVWQLPVTILIWFFYLLPLIIAREIEFVGWERPLIARFRIISKHSWWRRMWTDWAGCALPHAIIHRSDLSKTTTARTIRHEIRHCHQMFVFGPFFYPLYGLCTACLWVYHTLDEEVHPYFDNLFEQDARRHAGQLTTPPHGCWPKGPDDFQDWW